MKSIREKRKAARTTLPKSPSGIRGLDEITGGGLPKGRPTLLCGSTGCGKTLMSMEFLVHGAMQYDEPGVFMAFEETAEELSQNVASLGFDLDDLAQQKKLLIDYVHLERSEIEDTGEFDLDGIFIRLGYAIDALGAKRVVLDTLEALFAGLPNEGILRAELRRLFRWLKDKGVTTIVTAERGDGTLTRHGLEEYISDCVLSLDHRVTEQVSTRRLRVIKYRGSSHGTNEYPFLIDHDGISILPITSLGLDHESSDERVSTGVTGLDEMLSGKGVFRGSSTLISGTAGTGKTSLAAHFANAACQRGETCLYFAFEESQSQITRNMRSIGLNLMPWFKKGLLHFHASRPSAYGLEMHLASMHKLINDLKPRVVIVDPITNLSTVSTQHEAQSALLRLIDFLKAQQITTLFTGLSHSAQLEQTDVGVSSLMDTWILVRDIEIGGERNRGVYILKSRGMAHSNQIREIRLTDNGIAFSEVYLGPEGVLTGSARLSQESKERRAAMVRQQEVNRMQRDLTRKREALEARIAILRSEYEADEEALLRELEQEAAREQALNEDRLAMSRSRKSNSYTLTTVAPKKTRKMSQKHNGGGP